MRKREIFDLLYNIETRQIWMDVFDKDGIDYINIVCDKYHNKITSFVEIYKEITEISVEEVKIEFKKNLLIDKNESLHNCLDRALMSQVIKSKIKEDEC